MSRRSSVLLAFAMTLAPAVAPAAQPTQASQAYRNASPEAPFPGRSDGLYFGNTYEEPWIFNGNSRSVTNPGGSPAFYMDFTTQGDGKELSCLSFEGIAYVTTTLLRNDCNTSYGFRFTVQNLGTQTVGPDMDAASLDISGTQTDDIGMELTTGTYAATGRPFAVGRDGAFFTCATIAVEDVSGTDDFHVGFRALQVPTATFANYTDYAVAGWNGSASPQLVEIEQDVATSETIYDMAATAADTETHTYCVYVGATGAVTATFDANAAVTGGTFADGQLIVPWIYMINTTDIVGEVDLTYWYAGFQNTLKTGSEGTAGRH
jgi:hypothetical protein